MTKLRYGPASDKIKTSTGPDSLNKTSMYHTSYASCFSKGIPEKKKVHSAKKTAVVNRPTGYNANFRPCIYYTPTLDDLDNKSLKLDVNEHYRTAHDREFRPYHVGPTGEEMSLRQYDILPSKTGFTRMGQPAFIQKSSKQIKSCFNYKRPMSTLFQTIKLGQDPIEQENGGAGPNAMSTENGTRYQGCQYKWPSMEWRFYKSVGKKEPTANTRPNQYDPILYMHGNPYDDNSSNNHKLGISEQQCHFRRHKFHMKLPRQKANGIPEPVPTSNRITGYSHETTKPRYTEHKPLPATNDDSYLSVNRSDPYKCTLARHSFTAPGKSHTKLDDGVGRRHVGDKEATGYVKNHPSYEKPVYNSNDKGRFFTHYTSFFNHQHSNGDETAKDLATLSLSSAGWPVHKSSNGFTKSTRVHVH